MLSIWGLDIAFKYLVLNYYSLFLFKYHECCMCWILVTVTLSSWLMIHHGGEGVVEFTEAGARGWDSWNLHARCSAESLLLRLVWDSQLMA